MGRSKEAQREYCSHGVPSQLCNICTRVELCPHRMSNCVVCDEVSAAYTFGRPVDMAGPYRPVVKRGPLFTVPRGQLTFDAEGEEGGPNHSRRAHWAGEEESGVTIGRGYDMKGRKPNVIIADLTRAGVPLAQAQVLAGASGKKGKDAQAFTQQAEVSSIEITTQAQKTLFTTVYDTCVADVRFIFEKKDTVEKFHGKANWDDWSPAVQDVLVDLMYRGDYSPTTRNALQPILVAKDFQALYALLSDKKRMTEKWFVPLRRFEQRRDFLNRAMNEEKARRART